MYTIPRPGAFGSNQIADTNAHTGAWFMITILADTVFTTLTAPNRTTHGSVVGKTYTAGTTIYGYFTAITLASGWVEAYNVDTTEA